MIFFAWLLVFGSFVHTQSLNPRSVNVALETVLEFDGKHNSRDVKAIDKLQNYLDRIKKILTNNDYSRRSLPIGFKFRDFLKSALQTIASYDDNDLLDVVAVVNNEIRKYHYKGCRFYELVENQNMRRDMAEKLVNLNELTAKELRAKLNKAAEALESDAMTEQKRKMIDYLDSVYVGDDVKNKMETLVTQLDQFKRRSKRANLNLAKVINEGLRFIIFDHYTNLNVNARKELKDRLETFWRDFKRPDTVKDVWHKIYTTKSFSISGNNYEIVYPKKHVSRSKTVKKAKKSKYLEPRLKADYKKVKRTKLEPLKKEMPKILLRKKTDRFKKYNKKDKLRTLKPSPVLILDSTEEDVSVERGGLATAVDSVDLKKSKLRLYKNKNKKKKRQRKRKQEYYVPTKPMLIYFKNTRRSNDYEDKSDEGLHIQSFEKPKPSNYLRISFPDDGFSNTIQTTSATPNVHHRIDKLEKVLDEIKNLVALRRKANEFDEEKLEEPEPPTTKIKQTESTVTTTTQTSKMTLPVTESTTQKTTTEVSTIKAISKPQITITTKAPESNEADTKILTKIETIATKTKPLDKTESPFSTKEMTTKYLQLESTVKKTSTLDLISNDTRRSDKEHVKDKSRSVREAKIEDDDLDIHIRKTRRSNDNFKDMVNEKLKSIKDRELTDRDTEPGSNKQNLKDKFKGFDTDKIGKYHEFPDVQHSKEQYDNFEDFVSDKTKSGKERELPDIENLQNRRSNVEFRGLKNENKNFGKEHDIDKNRHNKPHLNDNFKDFKQNKIKFDKDSDYHEITDAERFKYNFDDDKDIHTDDINFDMEHHSKDNYKDFIKEKIEPGKEPGLADIERIHKTHIDNMKNIDENNIKIDKLTDPDVQSMYDAHQALKNKYKTPNDLSDLDIEHMYNDTRRAQLDKIMDKNSEGDKEMHKRVREKIAGHMEKFIGMKKDGKATNKFDFHVEDPFNLKEDDFNL